MFRITLSRVVRPFAVALALTLILAACAPSSPGGAPAPTSAPKARTDVVIATQWVPTSLDPTIDSIMYSEWLHVFDRIIDVSSEVKLVPSLATSWQNVDPVTWEFKLRQGVKFHNGKPLTAKDVKFTMDRILDPNTKSRQVSVWFNQVASLAVVDDYTFRVTTKVPYPSFPEYFSFLTVVPADTFQEMGAEKFAQNPVGTGPYKLVEWVKGDHVTLEANPDYWGGAPSIKKVTIRNVVEPSTRLAMLRSGDADIIDIVPYSEVGALAADPQFKTGEHQSMEVVWIGMNSFKPPFTDVKVRQAFNYAVNWDEIIQKVLYGKAVHVASSIGELTFGWDSNLKPYPYDPEKAKQLLAEAGYPQGLTVDFDCPTGRYAMDKDVCEAVASQLAKASIKANLKTAEWGVFWTKFLAKELPGLHLVGCQNASGGDFDLCNRLHYHSKVRGIYYNSPKVDALLDEEASIMDRSAREAKLKLLLAVIKDEAPWIFGYQEKFVVAHKKDLNWTPRADVFLRANQMSWSK